MAGPTSRSSSLDTGTLTAKNAAASRADRIAFTRLTARTPRTAIIPYSITTGPAVQGRGGGVPFKKSVV